MIEVVFDSGFAASVKVMGLAHFLFHRFQNLEVHQNLPTNNYHMFMRNIQLA